MSVADDVVSRVARTRAELRRADDQITRVRLAIVEQPRRAQEWRAAHAAATRANTVDLGACLAVLCGLVAVLLAALDAEALVVSLGAAAAAVGAVVATSRRRARRRARRVRARPEPQSLDALRTQENDAIGARVRALDAYDDATGRAAPGEW